MLLFVCPLETNGGFLLEETIGTQGSYEVHQEIVNTAMARMFNIAYIFQFIVNSLYNRTFSEHYFIKQRHKAIFHIGFDSSNNMYALSEQHFEQTLRNVAFVAVKFTEEFFLENFKDSCVSVIGISGGKVKAKDFSFFITNKMQLESKELTNQTLSFGYYFLKGFMLLCSFNMACAKEV